MAQREHNVESMQLTSRTNAKSMTTFVMTPMTRPKTLDAMGDEPMFTSTCKYRVRSKCFFGVLRTSGI